MITEQQLKDVLMGVWETEFKDDQPFERFLEYFQFKYVGYCGNENVYLYR